ncbi:MAG TPA: asparagine synthase-related protein [Thermoanaerobaculia bacterium]|nr:asparagine synthase-related protein [Thermoanaerobaculia bacterium]
MHYQTVSRVVNLIPDEDQRLANLSVAEARSLLLAEDPAGVLGIGGSFALVAQEGVRVCLARSLDRPLRYFLAKQAAGPLLVVADRIDAIRERLEAEGAGDQFHPSYTRMVPAHHVTEIQLVGCPDPNPVYRRFFDPPRGVLPPDLDVIGEAYVRALCEEIRLGLDALPREEPLGVLFSGGADSGTVLLCLHHEILARGESPARLKAFTLAVDGGGGDLAQAREFLARTGLGLLGEEVAVASADLDPFAAVSVIEDYKPLDVECATMSLALFRALRERYPDWRWLADGDGGDENLKDYPIEENPELTIRSVVNNRMLYQEGWGVEAIKQSLTYSGGLSRGCVRGYAPARRYGFSLFSPFTRPRVIAVAEAIPFADLTKGSHEALYALKGEVLSRGVRKVTGRELPVFPKRRFQNGAASPEVFARRFAVPPVRYRRHLSELYSPG